MLFRVLESQAMFLTGPNWASVTGRVRVGSDERAFTLIVDGAYPLAKGTPATVVIVIEGMTPLSGTVTGSDRSDTKLLRPVLHEGQLTGAGSAPGLNAPASIDHGPHGIRAR